MKERVDVEKLEMRDATRLIGGHVAGEFLAPVCGVFSDESAVDYR